MTISTRTRIGCARAAYRAISLVRGAGRGDEVTVRRGGHRWRLDLREGIDLSIYLFGSFEPGVVRSYRRLVRPGHVAVDVGANIGAHTLPLAAAVGATGRVFAFEPTGWAFAKLRANLELNPSLHDRVTAEQVMLVRPGEPVVPGQVYSSWPLTSGDELHPLHRGRLRSAADARAATLDEYAAGAGIERMDFVKLDVDGAEPDVLVGAAGVIGAFKPTIVTELAPYLYDGTSGFEDMIAALAGHGYRIEHLRTGRALPADPAFLRSRLPAGSSMNVLCRPA